MSLVLPDPSSRFSKADFSVMICLEMSLKIEFDFVSIVKDKVASVSETGLRESAWITT